MPSSEPASGEHEVSRVETVAGKAEEPSPARLKQAQDRKIKQRLSTVHTIVFQSLLQEPGRSLEARQEHDRLIDTLETLAAGEPQNEEVLGGEESGVNTTSRVEFVNDKGEKIIAYKKSAAGESAYDAEGYPTRMNPETGARERIPLAERDPEMGRLVNTWKSEAYFSKYAQGLKEKYGIPDEDFEAFKTSLREEIGGQRLGIEVGGSAVREKVVYDQAKMLGMDVVSATALREERSEVIVRGKRVEQTTLASVQEGIKSAKTGEPGRELYKDELMTLLLAPPEEWQGKLGFDDEQMTNFKESLVEAACLHWQTGQLDGHQENMQLLDTGHVKILDNGLAYSKKRGVDVKYKNIPGSGKKRGGEPGDDTEAFHKMRSVPMEMIARHPELKLSDRVRAKCLEQYTLVTTQASPEKMALEQMFKSMFPDRNVVRQEMKDYLLRLRQLAEHGRPPEKAFSSEELYSIGIMKMGVAKTREQVREAKEKKEMEKVSADFDRLLEEQELEESLEEITEPPKRRPPPPPPPSRSARPPAG